MRNSFVRQANRSGAVNNDSYHLTMLYSELQLERKYLVQIFTSLFASRASS